MMIKINLKDVTVLNSPVYFNNKALKYMKQKLIKLQGKKEPTTVVGDFNTPFAINSRTSTRIPENDQGCSRVE